MSENAKTITFVVVGLLAIVVGLVTRAVVGGSGRGFARSAPT